LTTIPTIRTGANIIEVDKKEKLQKLGTDGVEAELKRIREKTFERMRNHTNQSISWERILKTIENGKKQQDEDTT